MDGLDSKEWKSVVLPKIYEEKMQKLEAELEKKVRTLMAPVQALGTASSYPPPPKARIMPSVKSQRYIGLGGGGVSRCVVY